MQEDVPYIVEAVVQALLYGLYIVTLVHCVRWLLYADKGWSYRKDINWPMLVVTVIIFLLTTASLGLLLELVLTQSYSVNTANFAIELALIIITDAVLIYRCWAIYSHSWLIISLPFILWLGTIVCMSLIIYLLKFDDPSHLLMRHTSWEAFYSCNIAVNVYSTTAMVYRILGAAKGTSGISGRLYYKICRILSESGILFALSSLTNLIALILDTNPYTGTIPRKLFNTINVSVAGIAFNLILTRIGQERTNTKSVQGYSQNAGPVSTIQFDSPTVASSQAQTCDTACPEVEDRMGLDSIMTKVEPKKD